MATLKPLSIKSNNWSLLQAASVADFFPRVWVIQGCFFTRLTILLLEIEHCGQNSEYQNLPRILLRLVIVLINWLDHLVTSTSE